MIVTMTDHQWNHTRRLIQRMDIRNNYGTNN